MTYKHILYKHVKVHMTGNYSEWVQGMMEHHRVQKIRKTTRLPPCRCSHRCADRFSFRPLSIAQLVSRV